MKTTLGKIGWIVLLVINGLMLLNNLVGTVFVAASTDERQMFIAYAATTVLGLLLLWFPYRSHAKWAWWGSWVPILSVAVVPFIGGFDGIGVAYGLIAVVMAIAQVLTAREFFTK